MGSESRINISENRWLNDEQMRKVISPKLIGYTIQIMKELMNQDIARWNQNILTQLFNYAEIQAIKRTPISTLGISDRLVSTFSKNGQYMVNSGYMIAKLCDNKMKGVEGTSSKKDEKEGNLWKGILGMNIKKKVQHVI